MNLIKQNNTIIVKIRKDEIKTIDFATCAQPTQTLDSYYKAQEVKPDVLINGGLFAFSTGKSVMDFIDEGKIQSAEDWIQYGIGITHDNQILYGKDSECHWKDFISAYPPLVTKGQKATISMASEIAGRTRRTILGYDEKYVYVIIIDAPGATLSEAADIVLNTGCVYAINLDGGGSTRLIYQGKVYAAASYNRPVDNVVAVYLKQSTTEPIQTFDDTIYRVQLGAFSTQANAVAYCEKVKTISSNYKNAFVKYIAPYYKVQVGAFSVRQNAENMLKDLQSKGYNAFIVSEKKTNLTAVNKEEVKEMSSPLVAVTTLSPNHSGAKTHRIDRITPHCVVGQCSAEALGAWFAKSSTKASSNYGIDKDGRIGLYVEEENRSWCSSNTANDNRAITIECASDTFDPYRMNEVVFESLVKLCIDICKRYNRTALIWIADKDIALAYEPAQNEMLLTVHRWFANKSCPGDWLYNRLGELANRVTEALEEEGDEDMTQEKFNEMMNNWIKTQAKQDTDASWSAEARAWAESNGFIQGDENGNKMYKKYLTREEFVTVLYRIIKKLGLIR